MLLDIFLESGACNPTFCVVGASSELLPGISKGDEQFDPEMGELR